MIDLNCLLRKVKRFVFKKVSYEILCCHLFCTKDNTLTCLLRRLMRLHWWAFYHYNFTLISCPLLDSLVSLSWWVMELNFIINFPLFRQERVNHLWGILQAAFIKCLNTWRNLIGSAFGRGHRFVFRAYFPLYIPYPLSSFLLFQPCWSLRESLSPYDCLVSTSLLIPSLLLLSSSLGRPLFPRRHLLVSFSFLLLFRVFHSSWSIS